MNKAVTHVITLERWSFSYVHFWWSVGLYIRQIGLGLFVFPVFLAALALEPLFERWPVGPCVALQYLSVGHGGSFE
jgi:hypothetical protein